MVRAVRDFLMEPLLEIYRRVVVEIEGAADVFGRKHEVPPAGILRHLIQVAVQDFFELQTATK